MPMPAQMRVISGNCFKIWGPVHLMWDFQFYKDHVSTRVDGVLLMALAHIVILILIWIDNGGVRLLREPIGCSDAPALV